MTQVIKDSAKVRVVIAGVVLQTTARNLRRGTISAVLYDAFQDFERDHKATGITGKAGRYLESFTGKEVDLQFDLY